MSEQKHPSEGVPGCGFAAYSLLLLGFFGLGLAGMVSSTLTLIQANSGTTANPLLPGSQVAVWQLQPFRDVGLLELTEAPGAWHDETGDGTTACAMTNTAVIRVEDGQGQRMAYTDIGGLAVHTARFDIAVELTGRDDSSLTCHFNPKEGSDRFARMVAGEAGLEWLEQAEED
jgi:hypothetical protein